MSFSYSLIGINRAIQTINAGNTRIMAAGTRGMVKAGQNGETIVKRNQSGRPGPNVITGDFRRATIAETQAQGTHVVTAIGNNSAQALRLEFGFHGADRLGRVYDQSAYPSFGPAAPEVFGQGVEFVRSEIERAF